MDGTRNETHPTRSQPGPGTSKALFCFEPWQVMAICRIPRRFFRQIAPLLTNRTKAYERCVYEHAHVATGVMLEYLVLQDGQRLSRIKPYVPSLLHMARPEKWSYLETVNLYLERGSICVVPFRGAGELGQLIDGGQSPIIIPTRTLIAKLGKRLRGLNP